ncbi:MAG: hypothetical protein Q9M32_07635 [Sulfurimonas sp.]|nr:hypothetical protein [Sulfurimonas sp.]
MINKLIKTTLALSLAASVAYGANGARMNEINGDVAKKYEKLLNDTLESKTGFAMSDGNGGINDAYAKRYGNKEDAQYDKDWTKTLDNLGFFGITNDAKLNSILKTSPQIAGFAPFNQLIYKKVGEDKTYIGHLDPATMLDIVGAKDKKAREDFVAMFTSLDKWTQDEFGGTVKTSTFSALPANPMMNFEIAFDRPEDLSEYIGTFQENFEAAFEDKKYIIAGYKDFKEAYEDLEMSFEEYDAFFVYSLCHFTFSYNIFNKGRPDAGVFAPCSMYMYVKKDAKTMVVGMPTLANWASIMNIKDTAKLEWIKKIDAEIISIMKSMGAKQI